MSGRFTTWCNVFWVLLAVARGHDFRHFDDTILFSINWSGEPTESSSVPGKNVNTHYITTAQNEKYMCLIPELTEPDQDDIVTYAGPSAMEIISEQFSLNSCSHKVDSYWTYELCHGKYVRQFHEDREGKKLMVQQYYLGRLDRTQQLNLLVEYKKKEKSKNAEIPVKKIDRINMPYVEVEMGDGTVCDITNAPRKVKVLYICHQHGQNEIFSVKEISSCEYEVIAFSPLLCAHPAYRPKGTEENIINCQPIQKSPRKPKALVIMETESFLLRHQRPTDDKQQKVYAIFHVDKEGQDGEARVRFEIHPVDVIDKQQGVDEAINSITDQGMSPAEMIPVQTFLSGKNCLHGGNGWWKYEFCYGRSVSQYHIERDGTKTMLNLGKFDKEKHLEWIAAHPHKRPKPLDSRKYLSHFYSDGTICDKTGNPRQTEVKLKCLENYPSSPSSVSLFLVEPKTCEYVLGVESPLICDILEYADENGLLNNVPRFEMNFDKLKTSSFQDEQDNLEERIANGDD